MTETTAEEDGWVDRAAKGDRDAFNRLVERYNEAIVGYLRTFTANDADDLAQKVWLQAWAHLAKYDRTRSPFYSWVRGIARHLGQRWRRKRVIEVSGMFDDPDVEDGLATLASTEQTPQDLLAEEEKLRQRHLAYCRLFYVLFRCGGYPHEQLGFGLAKLIYGQKSNRAIEGAAAAADANYGAEELGRIAEFFCEEYQAALCRWSPAWPACLSEDLRPLRIRLQYTVGELKPQRASTGASLQEMIVGHTHLKDYYGGGRRKTHPISDWCGRVESQLRRVVGAPKAELEQWAERIAQMPYPVIVKPAVCNRCKLRHFEPCFTERGAQSAPGRPAENRYVPSE